jgi:DNA-binding NarL/FixJ family response regulator
MRLLIVADNALAAEAIRREMRYTSGFHVAGFINGRGPCVAALGDEHPDVVLVDDMRDPDATLERIVELRQALPSAKLVLLALEMDPTWLSRARTAGIDAAVAKSARAGSLGTIVREVVNGHVFHQFAAVQPPSAAVLRCLTGRERQTLLLAAAGRSNSDIAERLWVTEQTVKFHLSNVYRKLNVSNRTEASHLAHLDGLLDRDSTERAA